MMDQASLISFIFQMINAGVLVGMVVYLFKKYLRPTMIHDIDDRERYLKGLTEQKRALEYQQQDVMSHIETDRKNCALLRERIVRWAQKAQDIQEARIQEKVTREKEIAQMAQQREHYLAQQKLKQRVLPLALEQARKELEKKYASASAGSVYMDDVITRLEKDRS